MKRTGMLSLAAVALTGWLSSVPAHAVPPTVTPSPGYEARLQEQRAASRRVYEPVGPGARSLPARRSKKKQMY